jgi:hypothetical protein
MERCRRILGCIGNEAISPDQLVNDLQTVDHGNRQNLEDVGLCKVYRGYRNAIASVWVSS